MPPNNDPVNPYSITPHESTPTAMPPQGNNQGDATGGLIPYKNPKALIAYYWNPERIAFDRTPDRNSSLRARNHGVKRS